MCSTYKNHIVRDLVGRSKNVLCNEAETGVLQVGSFKIDVAGVLVDLISLFLNS